MSAVARMSRPPADVKLANIDAEAFLLSALLVKNSNVERVCDMLAPEDFAEHAHAVIYDAILNATAAGRPATAVTLKPFLENEEALRPLGGPSYLAQLSGAASAFVKPEEFADQIADLAARRRLIEALRHAIENTSDLDLGLSALVDQSDEALVAAVERRESWSTSSLGDCLADAIARIEHIKAHAGEIGATTGLTEMDDLTGGFEPGQLVIVGARPGRGKTAVACSAALGLGRNGHGVLFVSLEMRSVELGMRMLSDLCFHQGRSGIEFGRIVSGQVNADEMRTLCRAKSEIDEWPVRIVDAGSATISRIALHIRRAKRRMAAKGQKLEVVIIDYLQLIQPDQQRRSAYEAVSEVSRCLKALAKDMDVTIIALAQLNRSVEQREDKRPVLSDLRESGQLEQDADAVMFLYREEYYLRKTKPKPGNEDAHEEALRRASGWLELILAKRRNGPEGRRTVQYLTNYQAVRSAGGFR